MAVSAADFQGWTEKADAEQDAVRAEVIAVFNAWVDAEGAEDVVQRTAGQIDGVIINVP